MKKKLKIIAEVAQGYEGNSYLASLFCKGFIKTNADIIKFQLVFADELSTKNYQYYNFYKKLQMATSEWQKIVNQIHSHRKKIFFDIYGNKSLNIAFKIKADGVKISTADFYNYQLIKKSLNIFESVILTISGQKIEDIKKLIDKVDKEKKLILMYGFQSEPTKIIDNNLNKIKILQNTFPDHTIAFMDHTKGDSEFAFFIPMIAIGTGADIIEKHITFDQTLEIEDFISALNFDRFKKFVNDINKGYKSLGNKNFSISSKEKKYQLKSTKILVAKKNLKKNIIINENDIDFKRVKTLNKNNTFFDSNFLIGKKLLKNKKKDSEFFKSDFK